MRGTRVFLICFVAAFCLAAAGTAGAYHTQFVAQNCNWAAPTPDVVHHPRRIAHSRAPRALRGLPVGRGLLERQRHGRLAGRSRGGSEHGRRGRRLLGVHVQGLARVLNKSDAGFYQWGMLRQIHGPYVASEFKGGDGAPNIIAPKSGLYKMDAFASIGHVAMIYVRNADGTDATIEAKGERYGTNVWTRAYRGADNYGGVRRAGWSS